MFMLQRKNDLFLSANFFLMMYNNHVEGKDMKKVLTVIILIALLVGITGCRGLTRPFPMSAVETIRLSTK